MIPKKDLELYLHIPFCRQKCRYCDFLSAPLAVGTPGDADVRGMDARREIIPVSYTHLSMIIPELIRILVNDKAFTMDEAIEVVSKTLSLIHI